MQQFFTICIKRIRPGVPPGCNQFRRYKDNEMPQNRQLLKYKVTSILKVIDVTQLHEDKKKKKKKKKK